MQINCKLDEGTELPVCATEGSACVDLRATQSHVIYPGTCTLIKTGFRVAIPKNHAGLVCSRSGLALKRQLFVLNAPGIIDSDYRGDVSVILMNAGTTPERIEKGDRVAQLMIIPTRKMEFVPVEDLDNTERGDGGFGHTGQK